MTSRSVLLALTLPTIAFAQQGDRDGHNNMAPVVPESKVPPAPVLSPAEALKSIEVAKGFVVELFAAEPLVEKPVALDFDPSGRLWICEMLGYMGDLDGSEEKIPQGRIAVLEDTNGDGKADKRTVFLDKVLLPRALAVFADGLLYVDNNHLLWVNRDGLKPAGEPEIVVKGWAEGGNPEHASNGLVRGLDNWLYNAKSSKRIRRVDGKWVVEGTSNRGQWGIARDDYGRLYHNNNSVFLMGDLVAPNLLMGNPGVNLQTSSTNQLGSNQTWPIRVTPGINRAYMAKANGYGEDTLDPKTYKMTAATAVSGPMIYRGTNFPAEWYGYGISPEPGGNLIKAIAITDSNDGQLKGSHPYDKSEWLASTDERFRPVNLYNAPDGTVLVLDMYHGLLQHKTYLTTYLREQYKSRALDKPAVGQGRIYRVRYEKGSLEQKADFTKLDGPALVKMLAHKNGWHRDMAQRVLIERGDLSVVPLLEKLAGVEGFPLGSINAIWTLEGLGKLTASPLTKALTSKEPKVVCSALWATTQLDQAELAKLAPGLAKLQAANDEVKIYLARALGPLATPEADARLVTLISEGSKVPLIRAAAYSGLKGRNEEFKAIAAGKIKDTTFMRWLDEGAKNAPKLVSGAGLKGEHLESFNRGKALYIGEAACFGCHGPDGEGLPNLGPPLNQSEWVTGDPKRLAKIMLHGMSGPVTVAGKVYNPAGEMPGLAVNTSMTDAKLADIATYIRREWTNKADQVKPDVFKEVRKATEAQTGRPFTAETLK
jgi:mono/diheme cytochrome c family protein/glucose/arabinose dehydrogenase